MRDALPATHAAQTQKAAAGSQDGVLSQEHVDIQAPHIEDAILGILAATLDDIEGARMSVGNRLWSLRKRGLSPEMHCGNLVVLEQALKALEKEADVELQRFMQGHRLGPFVKATNGLGYKQVARLLGAIGDPASRSNVAKLRQYCGHGDPGRSRLSRDVVTYDDQGLPKLPYSPRAKMRVHLIAMKCTEGNGVPDKNGRARGLSPYRAVYDDAKAAWADRDTTDAHKHNHALKVVGKRILLDLWVEARRLRGHSVPDDQGLRAPEPCRHRSPKVTRSGAREVVA